MAQIEKRGQYSLRFKPHMNGGQGATKPTWTQRRIAHRHGNELFLRATKRTRTDGQPDGRADTTACAALSKRTKRSRPGWPPARHPPSASTASHDRVTDDDTRSFRSNGKMAKIRALSTSVRRTLVYEQIFVHFPLPTNGLRISLPNETNGPPAIILSWHQDI